MELDSASLLKVEEMHIKFSLSRVNREYSSEAKTTILDVKLEYF